MFVNLTGDYSADGKDDVGLYNPTYGRWYAAFCNSANHSFDFSPGPFLYDSWLSGWGIVTGQGKAAPPEPSPTDRQPSALVINANYPNPFNAATVISYTLPEPSHVRVDVYNLLGQKVTTLVDAFQEAGEHQVVWNAGEQPTGMYFYRIATDDNSETKKMLLIK